jgi:hypothetical protein
MSVFWIIVISAISILLIILIRAVAIFFTEGETAKRQKARAERVQRIIDILDDWFWAMENGTANDRLPDPDGAHYSEEYIDGFIRLIDGFFENELRKHARYWQGKDFQKPTLKHGKAIDIPPDFNRLKGLSREAFVQEIKLMTKWLDAGN